MRLPEAALTSTSSQSLCASRSGFLECSAIATISPTRSARTHKMFKCDAVMLLSRRCGWLATTHHSFLAPTKKERGNKMCCWGGVCFGRQPSEAARISVAMKTSRNACCGCGSIQRQPTASFILFFLNSSWNEGQKKKKRRNVPADRSTTVVQSNRLLQHLVLYTPIYFFIV